MTNNEQVLKKNVADLQAQLAAANSRKAELAAELQQERKRLDWAMAHDAMYYEWEGAWCFCYTLDDGTTDVIETDNPRATIDKLMGGE